MILSESTAPSADRGDVAGAGNRLRGGARIGPYEIVDLLGEGGMGQVYRARDTRLGREVAMKILANGLDEHALRRFQIEARAAASVDHPNVLAIHDIGVHEGRPYIISELLEGRTLRERLGGKPLPLREALDLAIQLAHGLGAAHARGIVHRDLKPENLFVTDRGRLKVLDFGIAKLIGGSTDEAGITQSDAIVGTARYMSPEQVRGEPADRRSDLFAFGAILSEMLSGRCAFERATRVDTFNAILNDEPPDMAGGAPLELERVVRRCLKKDPRERFQSADELAFHLAAIPTGPAGPLSLPLPAKGSSASLFQELKRRRVFRALVGYGIAAFAVLQIIEPIMHGLRWSDSVLSYVVVALALGFPLVVGLAWIFDVHAGGVERTAPAAGGAPSTVLRRSQLVPLLVGLGLAAAAPGLVYFFLWRRSSPPQQIDRSVAVLPFANLSSMKENEFFVDGMQSELITQLAKMSDLRVIARGSVQHYREGNRDLRAIAEALSVGTVLEGAVQRIGSRVRIAAQLVDPRTGHELWAERFDRDVADVFAIQTEVALDIARALHARLSPAEKTRLARKPTGSIEAYDFYLGALEYHNRPDLLPQNLAVAERLYQKAIEADPAFLLARARLAYLRLQTYWFIPGTPERVAEQGREEAEEVLRLQPDLPEAHLALGYSDYWGRRDYEKALHEFEIARLGAPSDAVQAIGFVLRRLGRFEEAIENQKQSARLDPRSPRTQFELAVSLLLARRYEEAEQVLDRTLAVAPDFVAATTLRAVVLETWKGQTDPAKAVLRDIPRRLDAHGQLGYGDWGVDLLRHHPHEALLVLDSIALEAIVAGDVVPKAFLYAIAHEALGEVARARQEYEAARPRLEAEVKKHPGKPGPHSLLARAYAGLARKADALREARRAVEILPISKDAFYGTQALTDLAAVEARSGEANAAIDHLQSLLSIPSLLSPALLRIDPAWAPLRNEPRFRALAGLGPP